MSACDPAPQSPPYRSPLWIAFGWSVVALSLAYASSALLLLPESNDCRYSSSSGDLTATGFDVFPPDQWCEYNDTEMVSSAQSWSSPVLWTATASTLLFGICATLDKHVFRRRGGWWPDPGRRRRP
ncbi:hypothetical protein AB0G74_33400 [Streptomyces sp. NPDC020875]|uniref:hypothetical protein n=1 Tax=Streptomyces sp. NPDC020875 TaxID=3154898 RepID=UPI0033F80159